MKRRALLAVVCILLIGACSESERRAIGSSDDESDRAERPSATADDEPREPRTTTTTRPEEETEKDLQIEAGFTSGLDSINTRYTSVGAIITNPNTTYAAYDVTAVFNLLAADGTILDTESAQVPYIPADSTVPVAPMLLGFDVTGEPASVDVQIAGSIEDDDGWDGVGFSMYNGVELVVADAAITKSQYSTDLSFTVTNPSDRVGDFASWTCVLRNGGVIVGGESSAIIDPVVPGGTVRVDSSLSVDDLAADEFICRAYF